MTDIEPDLEPEGDIERRTDTAPAKRVGSATPAAFDAPAGGMIDALVAAGQIPAVGVTYEFAVGDQIVVVSIDGDDADVYGDDELGLALVAAAEDGYSTPSGQTRNLDLSQQHQVRQFLELNHGHVTRFRHEIRR